MDGQEERKKNIWASPQESLIYLVMSFSIENKFNRKGTEDITWQTLPGKHYQHFGCLCLFQIARGLKWLELWFRSAPKVSDGEENISNQEGISPSLFKSLPFLRMDLIRLAGLRWCSTMHPASLVSAVTPPQTSRRQTDTAPSAQPAVSWLQ